MTECEQTFDALRFCVTKPDCGKCPWYDKCERNGNRHVSIPTDLALAVLRELADIYKKGEKNMELNEYQKLAARTINNDLKPQDQVRHALFGLAAETGEILGLYQKRYQGHILTIDRLIDEGGDLLWMLAELFTAHGVSLEEVACHNIEKLKRRYPAGFDPDKSLHRGGENDHE